jgi:hypothetical protein
MSEVEELYVSPPHEQLCRRAERLLPELLSMPKAQFTNWLWQNEELYGHFMRFAQDARTRLNRRSFSVYMIRERVRWYVNVENRGPGEFKISNNLTPYIARTLMMDDERLANVFKIKGPE